MKEEYTFSEELLSEVSPLVLKKLKEVDVEGKMYFEKAYIEQKKSLAVAYVIWFFGFHNSYFGNHGKTVLYIITLLLWVGIIWCIYDAIYMKKQVNNYNEKIQWEILNKVKYI